MPRKLKAKRYKLKDDLMYGGGRRPMPGNGQKSKRPAKQGVSLSDFMKMVAASSTDKCRLAQGGRDLGE